MRVDPHRFDVDAEDVHELDLGMLLHEVLQIRLMLEEVRVDFLVVRREVWLHIVVELDDLELHTVLFELGLDRLEDLGMGDGGGADLDDLLRFGVIVSAAAANHSECCNCEDEGEQFFHRVPPCG